MTRSQLDQLVSWVREQYYAHKSEGAHFMGWVCKAAHRYWLNNPGEYTEAQLRSMLSREYARINRKPKEKQCKCGKVAYKRWGRGHVCWECHQKYVVKICKTRQLTLEFS